MRGDQWALDALTSLCAGRPDLAEYVKQRASNTAGIKKAVLLHCVEPTNLEPVFSALEDLVDMSAERRANQHFELLTHIELNWEGKERLFLRLLKLRETRLASEILGHSLPLDDLRLKNLDIGPIDWWLEWMNEVVRNDVSHKNFWFPSQLGGLFASYLNLEAQNKFLEEFNNSDSQFRFVLAHFILPWRVDITTKAFTEDAISYLLADLNRARTRLSIQGPLLGNTATEEFVSDRLLPLVAHANPPLLENLREVIRMAGSRHGRRYILEERSVRSS